MTSLIAAGDSFETLAKSGERTELSAFLAHRREVTTPQGRIACIDRGRGNAALFLHGFPLNSFQWRGAIERLAPYRRCIAPDFLGLGYTEVTRGGSVTPDTQVEMLVALLDALSVPQVDVIANDSGGAVAQLFVVRHPHRVRTLLLTNCDTEIDSPPPALLPVIKLAHEGRFVDEWLAPWRANKTLARSKDGIGGMCYADPAHPSDEAIDYYFTPLTSSRAQKQLVHAYATALDPNPLAGIEPALRRCDVPTRILWGTSDTIFSLAAPDYLDRTLGASRGVRRLEGSKLFWPEERPDVIADEAKRLWSIA
jgi:pimeloyl-ACP methyl ester carboxylesterase